MSDHWHVPEYRHSAHNTVAGNPHCDCILHWHYRIPLCNSERHILFYLRHPVFSHPFCLAWHKDTSFSSPATARTFAGPFCTFSVIESHPYKIIFHFSSQYRAVQKSPFFSRIFHAQTHQVREAPFAQKSRHSARPIRGKGRVPAFVTDSVSVLLTGSRCGQTAACLLPQRPCCQRPHGWRLPSGLQDLQPVPGPFQPSRCTWPCGPRPAWHR